MPTIGGIEMLVIAIVAIVVVGPKDLPKLMRGIGSFFGNIRSMADDFQNSMNDLAREADIEDIRREMDDLRTKNVISDAKREIEDAVGPVMTPETLTQDPLAMDPLTKDPLTKDTGEEASTPQEAIANDTDAAEPAKAAEQSRS